MAYKQEVVQKQGFRKRWPILCFCLAAMFFIIGGGLLGAWVNSAANDQCTVSTNDFNSFNNSVAYSDCHPKGALWYAGIACVALGVIFKIAFWITLIIWCVKRRSSRTVVYVNAPSGPQQYEPYRGAA
jgi:hypothetical protein